ncbi:MAG TPA: restriction endonuclease, partial [bacterium]|nr:restriction endonuclease [bacterium]
MPESKKYYENRSLFSDYYLENRMADHPRWEEDLSDIFQEMQAIYQEHRDHLDGLNEAQTEEEFIRPVLNILGFTWDVQTDVERQGRHNYPDYSLFQDEAAKKEALRHRDDPGMYYSHAIALADAKYWGRPLDQKLSDPREEYTNRNPSFQIIHYLVATGLEWGIVTNGAVWRLYSTKARSRVDTYYEMNLQKMLENAGADSPSRAVSAENLRAFKYFYHFFRAAAFIRDPETKKSFLEQVFDGSVNYGSQLQTRLKNLIFDQIFVHLAEGFIQHQRQNDHPEIESQENLDAIYEGTLRLLYRLLFILYAEARDLLPVKDEHGYRNYSLLSLKQRAAKAVDRGDTLVSIGHDYWNDLRDLFRFIDQGEPDLNIPRYNGGLFRSDHPKNDFFEQNMVPDKYLVPALDLLTRDVEPDTGQKRFIDYKTLDVEQLGSIYEGLLEFHLRIAEKELAVVKEKGAEAYKSLSEVKNPIRTVQPGEPYLENDKGQRKATGSYYTPDYIVQYIVENTVGSVLKERADQFGKLMDEIQERQRGRRKQSVRQLERQASESLLGIKICDPAMGSGHFLVRATDYLTEQIILELNKYPDNPVIHRIETIRNDVVETLEEQGIAIDRDALKDTNLLKRMVMKQCIYGVDLNPMAVELAKLSLWLDSFTIGAPLSFLDHHLKV